MHFRQSLAQSWNVCRRNPALLVFPLSMFVALIGGSLALTFAGPAWIRTSPLALSLILLVPGALVGAFHDGAVVLGVQRARGGRLRWAALLRDVRAAWGRLFRLRLAIAIVGQSSLLLYLAFTALHGAGVASWMIGLALVVLALPLAMFQVTFISWATAAVRIAALEGQDAKTSAALAWRFLHGRLRDSLRFVIGTQLLVAVPTAAVALIFGAALGVGAVAGLSSTPLWALGITAAVVYGLLTAFVSTISSGCWTVAIADARGLD